MFGKKSFIILALTAACAAADEECSWSPDEDKKDNSNSNGNICLPWDDDCNKEDEKETIKEDEKVTIKDSLCFSPSEQTEDDWWQIQD